MSGDFTIFNIELCYRHRQVDDFCCLSSLTSEAMLDLTCVFKTLAKPGTRACKTLAEAISNYQPKRIWNMLSKYRVPPVLNLTRGETVSPLTLLLQSPDLVEENPDSCPKALEMLLMARCSPNEMGAPMQSPLLFAVGSHDHDSVEDLLIFRADVNFTPQGREPPVCVAVRHRMRDIIPKPCSNIERTLPHVALPDLQRVVTPQQGRAPRCWT